MLTPPPGGVMDGELAIARRASRSERPPGVPRLLPLSIFDTATCRSSHSSEGAVGVCSGQANTGYCSRGEPVVKCPAEAIARVWVAHSWITDRSSHATSRRLTAASMNRRAGRALAHGLAEDV